MGMGFAPTWLRQVSHPPPASQNHFNHWKETAAAAAMGTEHNRTTVRLPRLSMEFPQKSTHTVYARKLDIPKITYDEKRSQRGKHCALAVVRRSQEFSPRRRPLSRRAGRPKFNQLETVAAFT